MNLVMIKLLKAHFRDLKVFFSVIADSINIF